MKGLRYVGISILIIAAVAVVIYLVFFRFEGEPPTVDVEPVLGVIGRTASLTIVASDRRSGLKDVQVILTQGVKTLEVFHETYPPGAKEVKKTVQITPLDLGATDGKAQLKVLAKDRSWRSGGNSKVVVMQVTIDTLPPNLVVLSRLHYLNQGGSGVVVYRSSEPLARSGVKVGELFFPGYEIQPGGFVSFFAIPYDSDPRSVTLSLWAADRAGNTTTQGFHYSIKPRTFRKDSIQVSDSFLQRVMPYFMKRDPKLRGDLLRVFLKVNGPLRRQTERRIKELCNEGSPKPLWNGPFLRMKNAKTMSFFADRRDYFYKGRKVDAQVHLGMDLASLASSPVEAANSGKVAFAGELGIYGNTVILDHGCGLFSMYAHLGQIGVRKGQLIEKGQIIGTSDSTGLAGGDHLHFSMIISGVYVNPIEWWDPHWVMEHVTKRLDLLKAGQRPA